MTKPPRAAVFGCLLLALPNAAGCFSYHPATESRLAAEPIPQGAWPQPDTGTLLELAQTPPVIPRYAVDPEEFSNQFPDLDAETMDELVQRASGVHAIEIRQSRITGGGLLRVWNDLRQPEGSTEVPRFFNFGGRLENFIRRGAFLTPDQLAWEQASDASRERHGLVQTDRYRGTDTRGVSRTDDAERWRLWDGYSLGYSIPDAEPVGLVVHLTSLYENKYEHDTLRRLKRWGWAVGHIETRLGVRGPLAERAMDRRHEREALLESRLPQNPAEFTERVYRDDTPSFEEIVGYSQRRRALREELKAELPDLGTGFELGPDADTVAIADSIAGAVDLRLAEHAAAAVALVETIDGLRPDLSQRPLLITGFSAGALTAPTVAAKLRDRFPGRPVLVLLVGGGGSLLDIATGSTLTNGGIRLNEPDAPEPSPEAMAELKGRYERSAGLDPLKAAVALRDIPVLHIYADKDTVVPTAAAERFNAAHGSVDRLVHRGNHDTLFYFLNAHASRIRSWLREQGVE